MKKLSATVLGSRSKWEFALVSFVIFIFSISAIQGSKLIYEEVFEEGSGSILAEISNDYQKQAYINELESEYTYLLLTIISMTISGLGLIALLLLKLRNFDRINREKKQVVDLLVPRVAAMEAAMDGIAITNGRGEITYANMALAGLHGYNGPGEIIGQPWQVLYDEDNRRQLESEVFAALLSQWHWRGQLKGRKKDGVLFDQDVSMTALEDGGKVWVVSDNTEIMQYIALARQRLAGIEAAGDGIGLVDSAGNLTYFNKALTELHGIDEEGKSSYIGQPWENLYNERGREKIRKQVLPILREAGHWQGESPIVRKNGDVVFAEMSLTLLDDGGFIGTARDVTDRKQAEREKEDLQKQFFQAQKMEAIGRLAGGIAHDFNNILASMMGYSEFLIEDLQPESKDQHFARQIMNGCLQAQGLIEQILSFSRRSDTAREQIDLIDSVNETLSMLRATAPAGVALHADITAGDALVSANAAQVGQVLMNLSVNAIDAIDGGKGEIAITVTQLSSNDCGYPDMLSDKLAADEQAPIRLVQKSKNETVLELGSLLRDAEYICITVKDTGCGMPKEIMEHIFEPFYTTKPVDHGTGLGLSSVHGIMTAHGGALVVTSRKGKGTEFRLYFPVLQNQAAENAADDENMVLSGSGSILLVEDDGRVREMISQMLWRLGYDVHACVDGDEAVDYLRENPDSCDLILSDYNMPNMTGLEMAQEIYHDFPTLPVIIISGYSKRKLRAASAEAPNIYAVLHKPVRREILSKHIYMALRDKQQAA